MMKSFTTIIAKLSILDVYRGHGYSSANIRHIFRTQSNINDGVFFKKMVDGYILLTIFALNLLRISTQPLQTHHVDSTLSFKRGMHVVCL